MKARILPVIVGLVGCLAVQIQASGQAGVWGVIERVVLEPATGEPERIQVWGAFAIAEYMPGRGFTGYVGRPPVRGFMYFKLSDDRTERENARREWSDLKSVAGTRQAVTFAYWDRERGQKLMRVRELTAKPEDPDTYHTNVGLEKLSATGNHAAFVETLLRLIPR